MLDSNIIPVTYLLLLPRPVERRMGFRVGAGIVFFSCVKNLRTSQRMGPHFYHFQNWARVIISSPHSPALLIPPHQHITSQYNEIDKM